MDHTFRRRNEKGLAIFGRPRRTNMADIISDGIDFGLDGIETWTWKSGALFHCQWQLEPDEDLELEPRRKRNIFRSDGNKNGSQ